MNRNKIPTDKGFSSRISGGLKIILMPNISLLAPTNSAFDIFKDMLQRRTAVFEETERVWMNFLTIHRWLGSEEDTSSFVNLLDTHSGMLPTTCHDSVETL